MKVLVVGNGGREHALAWKISQSPRITRLWVAPGNAGTAQDAENIPIAADDIAGLVAFAKKEKVDLVVVGPEGPLSMGLVDALAKEKIRAFGPNRAAAQLEGSKVFCKLLLRQADVPTAEYQAFRDADSAMRYIKARYPNEKDKAPVVVKADGLASGKGVIVCARREDALEAIDRIARKNEFGKAGAQLIIEERLEGPEVSVLAITDGRTILTLPPAQDHKAAFDGDKGPNTGGMGAYSPAPVVTPEIHARVMRDVIAPTLQGMADEGLPYTGFLYAGLMIAADGSIKVLEYNCRFGDPETQPIMMRMKSDLVELCEAALEGQLDKITSEWDERVALGVVLAAGGYPDAYQKGAVISGLPTQEYEDSKVFHAGTIQIGDELVTAGGRVLCACALGHDIQDAQTKAYKLASKIHWDKIYYRTDIGFKAIKAIPVNK